MLLLKATVEAEDEVEMAKPEMVKLVRMPGMLVPRSCCDEAGESEVGGDAGDACATLLL